MNPIRYEFSYGFIGNDLELKKDIEMEVNNNGKISFLNYQDPEKVINLEERRDCFLIIPGFINSHTHIGDSFAKERGFDKHLIDVVAPPNGLKHELLRKSNDGIKVKGIINAVREMLLNGITFFIDFRENGLDGIRLLKQNLNDLRINYKVLGRFDDLRDFEKVLDYCDGFGFSSYEAVTDEVKERLRAHKVNNEKIFACHDAELERNEKILNALLEDKLIDVIIHGTHYTKDDLIQLKKKGFSLVICPKSNGYFGVGFPPINHIIQLNMCVSIGTDNVMVNSLDLFEELRYLNRVYRVITKNSELPARELLKMVTINAARNFLIDENYGTIALNKYADFFCVDLNHPNYYANDLEASLIYALIVERTRSENVKKVYIKGELEHERC